MAIVASGSITLIDLNDSKQLVSYIGASQAKTVIYNPSDNQYIPNYTTENQVLTPQLFIAGANNDIASQAKSTKWYYQENGAGIPVEITESDDIYTLGTGSVKTLTIKDNVLLSHVTMTYICEMVFTDPDTGFDVLTKSDIELVRVTNGQKGEAGVSTVIAILTNESHTIPTDEDGDNGNYINASTEMVIYEGTTDVSSDWSVTASASDGITGSLTDKTYTVTDMVTDSGYVDLIATRGGYSPITKRFVISKTKQGSAGSPPTTYWLVNNAHVIVKDNDESYIPTQIVVSAKSQTGDSETIDYLGRFRISESIDGINFTEKYISDDDQSTYTYPANGSLPLDLKAIKVELFEEGGTDNLLDEQIIPVISNGTDSVVVTVWTPDGNTLKNSEGVLTATITMYRGASEVTPSAFKWYIQDPTATTTDGGDDDGGDGWRLMTDDWNAEVEGYTTATIIIPASAIASVESFKCVATYNGRKYQDVCTVIDVTDPVVVTIVGMNTFKNGQGSTELKARLYRNGEEIDVHGEEYRYSWSLYNQQNEKTEFSATGKTITVSATDVDTRANLICEVIEK